jgi:PKD repeat protein
MNSSTNRRHRPFSRVFIALLLCVVAGASTIFPGLAFAQDAAEATAAWPSSDESMPLPDQTDVTGSLGRQPGTNDSVKAPLNATLLAEPTYGAAPLTVDFYVSLTNPQSSLVYQWSFGDGAVSSLPSGAYIPHVYQRPGTYFCSLTLMNAQGISTTLLTTVTVLPRHG